jgi:ribosome maturation protein SDO1
MVKLEDAVIARIEKNGEHFEILVHPDLAMDVKKGNNVDYNELLAVETVFKDAGKGTEQSPEKINEAFAATDIETVAQKIILNGTVQLTTEQRKIMREKRFKEVVQKIAQNAINPQTKAPHPPQRIENAIQEAGVHVDPQQTAEAQMEKIVDALRPIIPISFEKLKIAIKVPAVHAGRAYSALKNYSLKKEQWQNDGSLIGVVEIPAGLKIELMNELNHLTHGDVETKIIEE